MSVSDKKKSYLIRFSVLIIISIILNISGYYIASIFPVQFRVHTIGTIVATLAGGFIPGTISVFITNLIFKAIINEGVYYTAFNFIIVILVSIIRRHFIEHNKKEKEIYSYIVFTIILTAVFNVMLLYILGYNNNLKSDVFVQFLFNNFGFTEFYSVLFGNFIYEFIDISISAFFSYWILKIIPKKLKNEFYETDIWQNKLSDDIEKNIKLVKVKRSLKSKLFFMVNITILTTIIVSFLVSFSIFKENIIKEDLKTSNLTINHITKHCNYSHFDRYLKNGLTYEYTKFLEDITEFVEYDDSILYVFAFKKNENDYDIVLNFNAKTHDYIKPGTKIQKDYENDYYEEIIDDFQNEEYIIIDDIKNGKLLINMVPIENETGEIAYYLGCAMTMDRIEVLYKDFTIRFLSIIIILIFSEVIAMYWIINNNIVRPITAISYIVNNFRYEKDTDRIKNYKDLKSLGINTEDEVENLYNALIKTLKEEKKQSDILNEKNEKINEMQRNLISALAELVESRDNDTGQHIKKTAKYVNIIARKMQERDYYKTSLTDDFIENITYAAPLHDIGKIQVSDTILLKPGKLTDEEFERMKMHTIYGGQILEHICDIMPDISYIKEARFMAEYHHEKWNGNGYPHNIKGESIPLSARIMAVADVFDALVSERVYKKAFTFEETVEIITKESGKQFDPLVVDAFIKSLDEIKKVKEEYN